MPRLPDPALADFAVLYRTYYRQVRATVLGFRLPSGAVDDVIQDTFVSAWEHAGTLKDPAAFGGWLMTIARNRCIRELRRSKPTVGLTNRDGAELVLVADDEQASFHWEHSVALIRELIAAHEGEPRATVAKLFYLDMLAVKDIAKKLSMKPNTVLSHLHRFRGLVAEAAAALVEERGLELA